MSGVLRGERNLEGVPERAELGRNRIGIGAIVGFQACDQPFDGAELVAPLQKARTISSRIGASSLAARHAP